MWAQTKEFSQKKGTSTTMLVPESMIIIHYITATYHTRPGADPWDWPRTGTATGSVDDAVADSSWLAYIKFPHALDYACENLKQKAREDTRARMRFLENAHCNKR